ncbi:MAG: glycosyltransferase family 2 protein [bacterium]
MADKIPLSVVIIAKNEEANIEEGLKSVFGWVDEIIVVDDFSADKTAEISRKYGRVLTRRMENEGIHRNWAYAQAKNSWVLSLDADEKVTPELQKEISQKIFNATYEAFSIPLRNYIGNYWVKYGGWYPAYKLRLFLKEKFKYEEVQVHPKAFLEGNCGHLKNDIIHKGYPDLAHFLASVNRQTTLEAQKWIATKRKFTLGLMLWRAIDRFFRRYIRKKAYRDGFYGFIVAYFDTLYQFLSYVKYREIINREHFPK